MGNQTSHVQTFQTYYDALQRNPNLTINDVNPYDVLGVPKNFTWDELRNAYKRMARLVHPDKGGTEHMFQLVTECFKKLALEIKNRNADRPHHELKREFEQMQMNSQVPSQPQMQVPSQMQQMQMPNNTNASFHDKFNAFFSQNRMGDEEVDSGYGDMMAASSKVREELAVPQVAALKDKFGQKRFNKLFEEHALPNSKDVIIYKEPEAMQMARTLQFTELGGEKPDDFTHIPASARQGIAYTDYKRATSDSRLIDPRSIQARKEFKNVEDYSAHRENVYKAPQTEEEIQWRRQREIDQEERENMRLSRLRKKDEHMALHFEKMSMLPQGRF